MRNYIIAQKKAKVVQATSEDHVFVGLDVHKKSIHAAVRINGALRATFVIPASFQAVCSLLEGLRAGIKKVVYEAGPTGFSLARQLFAQRFPVEVIAPGKTPQPANQGSKSDRLDCVQLAEYAEKGMLKAVCIPTEQEEADRLLCRMRDQLIKKQRRVKQQIKSLLLYFGIAEPQGLEHWSLASIAQLRKLQQNWQVDYALNSLLDELQEVKNRLADLEKQIKTIANSERHKHHFDLLLSHPGVGTITAMKFLSELFRPQRFASAKRLTNYIGLAPRVRQTGQKRKEGPLQKSGQGDLRTLLIEASWRWRRTDPWAAALYDRLVHNTGSSQKAIVGVARHLGMNLWHMVVRQQSYEQFCAAAA
jgi:transposase